MTLRVEKPGPLWTGLLRFHSYPHAVVHTEDNELSLVLPSVNKPVESYIRVIIPTVNNPVDNLSTPCGECGRPLDDADQRKRIRLKAISRRHSTMTSGSWSLRREGLRVST
ncbi:hypothetical protein LLS1_01010 [Leifsonia sp. LS1]|nr:hypothetical protein LLS1_01010 [Leifsonia sp. LS1]